MVFSKEVQYWFRIALINLAVVAAAGILLRLKIALSIPWLSQKHLLHAHSHFAFSGWLSFVSMLLIAAIVLGQQGLGKLTQLLKWQLIAAYGMLIGFIYQGYGLVSITFSTASIVIAVIYTIQMWRYLKSTDVVHQFFKMALVLQLLSALGTFFLAYLMINHIVHQNWYLAAVYFFLHFQYNGWFLFTVLGLGIWLLRYYGIELANARRCFQLFAIAVLPAYFLSALWLPMPQWLYALVVLAAAVQCVGWMLLIKDLAPALSLLKKLLPLIVQFLLGMSALAFSVKLILQLVSTVPTLSEYAFGFRPVVIGYLHLVLLGVLTLFIVGLGYATGLIQPKRLSHVGTITFFIGVLLNEFLLMVQGLSYMNYILLPYANLWLLFAAIVMFAGLLLQAAAQYRGRISA